MRRFPQRASGYFRLQTPSAQITVIQILSALADRSRERRPAGLRRGALMERSALVSPRQSRSVLKLSLAISFSAVVALVAAIFVVGAPEADAAVYTLTGGCVAPCNWSTTTNWSSVPSAPGTYPGQVVGDTASVCGVATTLFVDVSVPQSVILNFGCTTATLSIPGTPATNHLTIEPSSTMGSGGNTININGGNLAINSGGTFVNSSGNTVVLNSGTASNLGQFANSGTFAIKGGTWTSSAAISILGNSTFNLTGGTLTNGPTTIFGGPSAGTMNWTGGTINGGGVTV